MERVAFVGLGRMGLPMASNLIKAGFAVVGCDLDAARAAQLAQRGGAVASTPSDAAKSADIVLTMVRDDDALRAAVLGPAGVLNGAQDGALLCDLSTVSPEVSAEARRSAKEAGRRYLCGKVAGSVGLAESAGLTVFASGEAVDFERCRPVLAAMGRDVRHVGAGEAAAYLKLAHSLIVGVYSAMIGEALTFGQKGGVPLDLMIDVLEAGPLGSRQLTLKAPILKARDFDSPPSDIDTAAKDMDLILEAARRDRTPLPLASNARQVMAAAQAAGGGRRDIYSILETFESLAGLKR